MTLSYPGAAAAAAAHRPPEPRVFLDAAVVLTRFSEVSGAPLSELKGRAVTREISRLRQEAVWLMRRLSTASLAHIGRLLDGRNMATIDEMLDAVALRSARDQHYRDYLQRLEARIAAAEVAPVDDAALKAMLRGILSDRGLADADARRAALALLSGGAHA